MSRAFNSITIEMNNPSFNTAIRFAGKFLAALLAVSACIWLVARAFDVSRSAGYLTLSIGAVLLLKTAHIWAEWLSGLLIFGIFSSGLSLLTRRSLVHPNVYISFELSALALSFYLVGYVVLGRYDFRRISMIDRFAFVIYLACMIWPIFTVPATQNTVTLTIAGSFGLGMAVIGIAYLIHRLKASNEPDAEQPENTHSSP